MTFTPYKFHKNYTLTCKENGKLRCTKIHGHVKYLINFLDMLLQHEFQALIQYKKFQCKDRPEMK